MKKTILSIALFGIIFSTNAQHNYDDQNTIYSFSSNVGVGTTKISDWKAKLTVNNSADYSKMIQLGAEKPTTWIMGIGNQNGDFFHIGEGNYKRLMISKSSGNVGVGTTKINDWKAKLTVNNSADYSKMIQLGAEKPTTWIMGIGNQNGDFFHIGEGNYKRLMISKSSGNVGIGTINPGSWKLAVNGKIRAKEIKVETGWSDFVFYDSYKLPTLLEVENYIKEKGHLKDIPSAKEVEENGIFLGEMDSKLLQKIEELTLYTIQQEKKIKEQAEKIENLEFLNKKLLELQSRLEKLESEK